MPGDGDQFVNQGGAMGDIQVVYAVPTKTPVETELSSHTIAIDVVLVPRREAGFNPGPHEVVVSVQSRDHNFPHRTTS